MTRQNGKRGQLMVLRIPGTTARAGPASPRGELCTRQSPGDLKGVPWGLPLSTVHCIHIRKQSENRKGINRKNPWGSL